MMKGQIVQGKNNLPLNNWTKEENAAKVREVLLQKD